MSYECIPLYTFFSIFLTYLILPMYYIVKANYYLYKTSMQP